MDAYEGELLKRRTAKKQDYLDFYQEIEDYVSQEFLISQADELAD